MTASARIILAPTAALAMTLGACSGSDSEAGRTTASGRDTANGAIARQSGPPIVQPTAGGYRTGDVASAGSVTGTLAAPDSGAAPAAADTDTDTGPSADRACNGARPADASSLAGAIVWLADVKTGKRLPIARRFVIEQQHCEVSPRVTAAIAGGTLHVKSEDRTTHRLTFTRIGTGETEATITQVHDGSLVATDKLLARPGLFEVRCAAHPQTHAWVAAFDHPYFTRPSGAGAFALDSVPPGTYRVMAWHERHGTAEGTVAVAAGQPATVALRFVAR